MRNVTRFAAAQLRIAAAGDELLGLDEEFDLPNAAAPELDVVAFHGNGAVAAVGMKLPLHLVDVGKRGEIEIFAPDEGYEIGQEPSARRPVAGALPCLDERRAFPVATFAFVIVERRRRRYGDLGRGRIRPQPHIHAKDIAVLGALPSMRIRRWVIRTNSAPGSTSGASFARAGSKNTIRSMSLE